ncbi:uncharacterized protein LOC127809391 [Diospyros lotus]|uniref:uncharacterized protein LOC127809391 n=1 Tax=Diospyros lotus TaxID=55363 RepID=UPI002256425F|nr:uncharacterized protein LOC127809391 [Diospyros lotus]
MTGVRGRYRAGRSGSRPNSSGSTAASTSSTAAPHISGDISPASLPSVSPVATPAVASSPTLPAESPVHPSSHSTASHFTSEPLHVIEQDGDGSIFCRTINISHIISTIFKKRLHKEGHVWKEVPSETKGLYWDEFAKNFQWDPTIDALVRREWAQKAAKRYIDNIRKWHANGKPIFVPDDVWDSWMQKWEQDEAFKKRSAQASLNRLSETGGLGAGPSRHTGGSISSAEHKRRMTHEFGREPTLIELFERTHSKKTEEGQMVYVDRRSSSVAEMYGQLLEQATQPNEGSEEPQQPDCDQIFIQAAGGKNKKKRIYGTGSLSQSKFSDVGSSSSVSSGLNENPVIQEMTEKLKVQSEQINSQAEQINSQAEQINSQAEQINSQAHELSDVRRQMFEMRFLIEQLTASTRGIVPSSSSSQPQSTHQPNSPNVDDDLDD